ncbi:conserved hypothetical protein [Listeria seeligeri FSL S4-171]|nr:conserved hypothetical protein [Listeria seeligeri FSL S4-171]
MRYTLQGNQKNAEGLKLDKSAPKLIIGGIYYVWNRWIYWRK